MRIYRRLAARSVGFALLLTFAASTSYAQSNQQAHQSQGFNWCTTWLAPLLPWCKPTPGPNPGPPSPSATPELDSLLLFGFGLTGIGGYAVTRYRARRPRI
jgi:hypothetical protein